MDALRLIHSPASSVTSIDPGEAWAEPETRGERENRSPMGDMSIAVKPPLLVAGASGGVAALLELASLEPAPATTAAAALPWTCGDVELNGKEEAAAVDSAWV